MMTYEVIIRHGKVVNTEKSRRVVAKSIDTLRRRIIKEILAPTEAADIYKIRSDGTKEYLGYMLSSGIQVLWGVRHDGKHEIYDIDLKKGTIIRKLSTWNDSRRSRTWL